MEAYNNMASSIDKDMLERLEEKWNSKGIGKLLGS